MAGFLEVVPSLCVSERYDSNVYYLPATPGVTRNDFVTHVSPTLLVNHNGSYASGVLSAGGFSETYVNNPNVDFYGTNSSLFLNLDNSIKRVLPHASLRITDVVRYAPTPPGFSSLAPGTSPGAPVNTTNVYAQGFLSQRTNNVTNTATVSASYATTASTSVEASYSYAILRFGSSPVATQTNLFDTTTHTGIVAGTVQVSGRDILSPKYTHVQTDFSSSALSSSVQSDIATLNWSRTLTPNLVAELGGGGVMIHPGLTTYAANAALIMRAQKTSTTINYVRTAVPNFQAAGVVIISDIFSVSATQDLDQHWQLVEAANYATGFGSGIKYDSYAA
ncbi:MAG TPA: hypothetical protein VIY86_10245, partial [Pirellulaceae bacterium]